MIHHIDYRTECRAISSHAIAWLLFLYYYVFSGGEICLYDLRGRKP
nr:MAG TPA: hypothetical protein [Caudoviricetes sp.]